MDSSFRSLLSGESFQILHASSTTLFRHSGENPLLSGEKNTQRAQSVAARH
jgi:hypothetical protein